MIDKREGGGLRHGQKGDMMSEEVVDKVGRLKQRNKR